MQFSRTGARGPSRASKISSVQHLAAVSWWVLLWFFAFGVGSARWPDDPPQSGVAHGFGLIPVSSVGGAVDEDKTRGEAGNSRTPTCGMVRR